MSFRRIIKRHGAAMLVMFSALVFAWPSMLEAQDYLSRLSHGRDVFEFAEAGSKSLSMTETVYLSDIDADKPFVLVVDPAAEKSGAVSITVNSKKLQIDPIPGKEGRLWYIIPSSAFGKEGNSIEVECAEGIRHAVLAPLESHSEEDHFGLFVQSMEPFAEPPRHPQQNLMDVKHLAFEMKTTLASAFLTATVEVTAESLDNGLTQCVLDLDNSLAVSSVEDADTSTPLGFSHTGGRLYIDVPAGTVMGDEFTARINYSGTPSRGYFRTTHSGVPLVYTYNQPYDARGWLPCKDVPGDKFTFEAYITVPSGTYGGYGITPVSNGSLESRVDNGDGTLTFHWRESFEVASYLVSLAITNYRESTGTYTALDGTTTMDVTHFIYPEEYAGASGEVTNTIASIEYFANTFGEYPFLSEKYSTAGWNIGSGMEHQTCTSMPDNNLAQPFHRRSIHELAHMWFGDMVTYESYTHLWLAEGWATYCEALMYGHLGGDSAYHNYINNWSTSDSRPLISPNQDAFDGLTFPTAYRKGAWVLHMLRHAVGDEDFFQATRNYLSSAAHQYGTANSDEFQAFFDAQVGEDMSWFFDQWLTRTSRPSYEWAWGLRGEGADTILDININQVQADSLYIMPIDFGVSFGDNSYEIYRVFNDEQDQDFSINVGSKTPIDVVFDPDNWVLETHQLIGIPTGAPDLRSVVTDQAAGTVDVEWWPYSESGLSGFRLYRSLDGATGWTLLADESVLAAGTTSYQAAGFSAGESAYFRLAAVVAVQGGYSDIYGVHFSGDAEKVLVVDGYDRWSSQPFSGGNNHAISVYHGKALAANGIAFDTCDNDALVPVSMPDPAAYAAIDWFLGDESTADETFSATEQALVKSLLDSGAKLYVSGNEIGWDLDWRGDSLDRAFYNDYLKAAFSADDSGVYTVVGSGGVSIFGTATYNFGFGDAPYLPGYPDVLFAFGSTPALEYSGGGTAAIQYTGTFGTKQDDGAIVYTGFAFETIYPESDRATVMGTIMDYLGLGAEASVGEMWLMY